MKTTILNRLIFALMATVLVVACTPSEEEGPVTPPEVELEAVGVTTTSLTFKLTTSEADEVKWLCYESADVAPDIEVVMSTGTTAEANKTVEIVVEYLAAATDYVLVAAASNREHSVISEPLAMTTEAEAVVLNPDVALEAVEAAETTLTFTITSSDVDEVRWVCIEKGSRTVNANQVLQNGTSVDVNDAVEVVATGLKANTEYEIYAAARGGEQVVMADALVMKTIYVPKVYTMEATKATATYYASTDSFYLSFTDDTTGREFVADVYVEAGHQYIPSGTYLLGGPEVGYVDTKYTHFLDGVLDYENFTSGELVAVATPDEATRLVDYTIEAEFAYATGDMVKVSYTGQVEGIKLPPVGVPEGYLAFEPHPETFAPYRRTVNNEKAGEYVLVFNDEHWGELILDIYADANACDQGNGHLPDGTYSLADGTMDSYSQVIFYEPEYWYCNFETCVATISRSGDEYTIQVDASGTYDTRYKKVWMTYTGKIKDITRE